MRPSLARSPGVRIGLGLGIATAAVFVLFAGVFAAHRVVTPMDGMKAFVDIGGEANLPTWWNSTLLVFIAMCALTARAVTPSTERGERLGWLSVAVASSYLSLDETAELHERLDGIVRDAGMNPSTYAWVIPGSLLAAVAVAVLVVFCRRLPAPVPRRLASALALYAFGALALEGMNGWIRDNDWSTWYTVGLIVEEAFEMGACVLAAATIADAIIARQCAPSPSPAPRR